MEATEVDCWVKLLVQWKDGSETWVPLKDMNAKIEGVVTIILL